MLESVKISRRQSEIRQELAGLVGKTEPTEDETRSMGTLDTEYRTNETRFRAALVAEDQEREDAKAMGWRTFLVVPENRKAVMPNASRRQDSPGTSLDITTQGRDILCPATAGRSVCAKCSLCMGTSSKASKSIWEVAHGENKENHKW